MSFPTPLYINSSHSSLNIPLRRVSENARSIIIKFPVRQSIAQGLYERTKKKEKSEKNKARKTKRKKKREMQSVSENMAGGFRRSHQWRNAKLVSALRSQEKQRVVRVFDIEIKKVSLQCAMDMHCIFSMAIEL